MSKAEVYVAMTCKADAAMLWPNRWKWAEAWELAAGEIAWREERAGRGEEFWSEVDHIEKENN